MIEQGVAAGGYGNLSSTPGIPSPETSVNVGSGAEGITLEIFDGDSQNVVDVDMVNNQNRNNDLNANHGAGSKSYARMLKVDQKPTFICRGLNASKTDSKNLIYKCFSL